MDYTRKEQARIIRRYKHLLPVSQTRIALLADTSLETVRRTLNDLQAHKGTLKVLREAFTAVDGWNGKLPPDLDKMFENTLENV